MTSAGAAAAARTAGEAGVTAGEAAVTAGTAVVTASPRSTPDRDEGEQASRPQPSGGLGNSGTDTTGCSHQEVDMADEAIVVSDSEEAATSR